jgi:hypothetical protein
MVRLQPDAIAQLDEWRRGQDDLPSRAEAIRRLVELGLKTKTAQAVMPPRSDPQGRQKIHRSTDDGLSVCGAATPARKLLVTTREDGITCERCRRMLRLVELGRRGKAR